MIIWCTYEIHSLDRFFLLHYRNRLSMLWDELVVIEELDSRDVENLALLSRPELGVTFTKFHAWRLTHYSKWIQTH